MKGLMNTKKTVALSVLIVAILMTTAVWAEPSAKNSIYAQIGAHEEWREEASEYNINGAFGYDRLISGTHRLYAGPRIGIYQENVLTFSSETSTKPFVGGHIYWLLMPSDVLAVKIGMAIDLLKGDDEDPIYAYIGAETGIRYHISDKAYLELPYEFGFFPWFEGTPYFSKAGFQFGYDF
jgi:hypothetical protein